MKKKLVLVSLVLASAASAMAQEGGGGELAEITAAFGSLTTLFGVFVTLAVTVTGFLVGRRWLRKV